MLCDILEKVSTLPPDVIVFYDDEPEAPSFFAEIAATPHLHPQVGHDLGEKMKNAFSIIFARGYKKAVIIGTDSPDLPSLWIEAAFEHLHTADAVYGPSEDGGYYLLGLKEMHKELFSDIKWSTEDVLKTSLEKAAKERLTVKLLPHWHDVDNYEDLKRETLINGCNGAIRTGDFIRKLLAGTIR